MRSTSSGTLVIIPTYNRAAFLAEAIESVITQSDANPTLLIVDDGSHDETQHLCQDYVARFPNHFHYLYQDNRGCSSARNRGLDWLDSRFDYVCFLDSDDRLLPGKLSREKELLARHPEKGFTYGDSVVFDEQSRQTFRRPVAASGNPEDFAIEHFLTNEAKCSAVLYRAAIIKGRRFREDLRYNEDSDFLQRIALENDGIYEPEPGCWIRWHLGSKSRNALEIQRAVLKASQDILVDYPDFYERHRARVDARLKRIQKDLFVEMMVAGLWDEAQACSTTLAEKFLAISRMGILFRLRRWASSSRNESLGLVVY